MKRIDFIAIDWGSTAFRAWAMGLDGQVIDSRTGEDGLKSVTDGAYAEVVRRHCGDWLANAPEAPVVLSGMVGSRTGWIEAPYALCPVDPHRLAAQAVPLSIGDRRAAILPGATLRSAAGDADVMRGEEVQLLGLAASEGLSDALICIPGTHSKWAELDGGRLQTFRTFVTGELFQLLRNQSLVGALGQGDAFDAGAFKRGLIRGAEVPLSNAVFATRANALEGVIGAEAVSSYLSGVLIGAEVAAQKLIGGEEIILLASGVLADRYASALDHFGIRARLVDAKTATRAGLLLVARELWFQDVAA